MGDTVETVANEATAVTILKPHISLHEKTVKLSAIDKIAPRDYISLSLFFRLPPGTDTKRIFRDLKKALRNTVDDIPELACCVQKHVGQGREEVQLIFDSNKGAELHFKDYTSSQLHGLWTLGSFDQLEQKHFPLSEMPRRIIFGTSDKLVDNVRLPSLVVQANFIPGGLILGSCLHHVSGDGLCNFLWHKTLGTHFAFISGQPTSQSTPAVRFLERSSVVEGELGVTLEECPNWKHAKNSSDFLNPTLYRPSDIATFEYAVYFISAEKLAMLKSRISINTPEIKLSTTEILGAFLWPHVVVAREIDPRTYPEDRLSVTVDARGLMKNPKVPLNYWGNFAEPNAVATLPVVSLQHGSSSSASPSEKAWDITYTNAARQIHGAIASVNDKAVRRLVGLLNQMPKSQMLTWNVDRYPGPDMLIVCIQGHRFNGIPFGSELGYSLAARCTVGDTEGKLDGRCMILPPRRADGRGLEVMLQYDSSTLKRLEGSLEFMKFFTRRN